MRTLGANRCLLIATISLVTATLPLAALSQEEVPAPHVLYVSDKLVLNVYAEPEPGSGRVATIQTGDAVDELERSGNMVRVRLEDGREGWVGANYLTGDAPAAVRLRELQREQKGLAPSPAPGPDKKSLEEIARLKKENTTLQGQVNELQSRVTALGTMAEGAPPETPSEPEVLSEPAELTGTAPSGPPWWTWLIAVVLTGALGYVSGYQTLARRLRRKFGGLKLY